MDKGKTLGAKRVMSEAEERGKLQEIILERYGWDYVKEVMGRLCKTCETNSCLLHPVTTKGEDCPYYKEKNGD